MQCHTDRKCCASFQSGISNFVQIGEGFQRNLEWLGPHGICLQEAPLKIAATAFYLKPKIGQFVSMV